MFAGARAMAEAALSWHDDARFRLMSFIHMTEKLYRAEELKILAFGAESAASAILLQPAQSAMPPPI